MRLEEDLFGLDEGLMDFEEELGGDNGKER